MKLIKALTDKKTNISNFLFLFCAYGVVVYWLRRSALSPDSTNYLAAASNLVEHGRMFVFTNWPTLTLDPVEIPYTVQPFGFPLYLASFIIIFKDSFFASVMAQSLAIILFFIALYLYMQRSGLQFWTRFSLLVIVCSLQSFSQIFEFLWTEPLFIALTIFLALTVHDAFGKKKYKHSFILSILLLFLSSSLRFIGIFNLGFFLPALLERKLRLRTAIFLGGVSLTPNIIWYFRNRSVTGGNFADHYGWGLSQVWIRLGHVFDSVKFSLAFNNIIVLILSFLLIIYASTIVSRTRSLVAHAESEKGFRNILLSGFLAQFMGLSLLGSVSVIGDLLTPNGEQARLFATVYALFFLWLHTVVNRLSIRGYALGVFMIIGLLGNIHFFSLRSRLEFVPAIRYPPEHALWNVIRDLPEVERARFFYSDYDFVHQAFSHKMQRIIWDEVKESRILSPETETKIRSGINLPDHPFILIRDKSEWRSFFDSKMNSWILSRREFPVEGYCLYFKSSSKL